MMKTNVVFDLSNLTFITHHTLLKKSNTFLKSYLLFQTINLIKYLAKKYHADGIIIACDSPNVWRRDIYPEYKANRKKTRDAYYEDVKEVMGNIKDFFNECTSIPAVAVKRAEADDIIASVVQNAGNNIRTVIISSDKDFVQLLAYDNVILYSPSQQKERQSLDAGFDLFEKCIRGDSGDNIKSAFPRVRKTVLEAAWHDSYKMMNLLESTTKEGKVVKDGYMFNKHLIDLSLQPDHIKLNISNALENLSINKYNSMKVLKFIGKHDMKNVSDDFLKNREVFKKHYISEGVNKNAGVPNKR